MSAMDRRDFGMGLALLGLFAERTEAQTGEQAGAAVGEGTFGPARVLLPALTKAANGSARWTAPSGTLATGEAISMHESVVPAGTPKGTLHAIHHSELIVVAEGTLSFQHGEEVEKAAAGSVIYVAYGTNHLIWNCGDKAARYFVLQIGGDTKKT